MSVCGQYKTSFCEASHCVFNGSLDDPCFRRVAIQRITARTSESVTLDVSGTLAIKRYKCKEYVDLSYPGIFGRQRTAGHPFKDGHTDVPEISVLTPMNMPGVGKRAKPAAQGEGEG